MANKMTQRDYFNEIIALAETAGREDIKTFAEGRIAALDKKSATKKPTKTQAENEGIKEAILAVLTGSEVALTVTEIQSKDESLAALSNQRVSAILRLMVNDDGTVEKTTDKKRSLFAVKSIA